MLTRAIYANESKFVKHFNFSCWSKGCWPDGYEKEEKMKKGFGFPECFLVMVLVLLVAAAALGIVCTVHKNEQRNRREIADRYEELVMTPEQKEERQQKKVARWFKSMGCSEQNAWEGVRFREKLKAAGSSRTLEEVLDEKFCRVWLDHNCCDLESGSKRRFEFELEGCEAGNKAVVTFVYCCRHGTFKLSETWSWKQHEDPT